MESKLTYHQLFIFDKDGRQKKAISLSFKCDQDWNAMTITDGGKFCATCQKKVYDFTDEKTAYFIRIMQENDQRVCGRFNSDQVAVNLNFV